jgi:nucleoid-associated protein YgaU
MVAALHSPPEYRPRPRRCRPAAAVPARVVPLHDPRRTRAEHATPLRLVPDPVLRPARPRATRSTRASVFWRRRLIAASLGLGIVLAAAHAGTALGGSTTSTPERRPHVTEVVVRPGDTLWTIAQRVAPNSDPRQVVDQMAAARGSADLRPGDTIRWPH